MTAWLGVRRSPFSSKAKPARRLGCFASDPAGPIDAVLGENRLNLVPQCLVDNRRMLSGIGIAFVRDLTPIDAVLKHQIKGAAGEFLAAIRGAVRQHSPLAPDPRGIEFCL